MVTKTEDIEELKEIHFFKGESNIELSKEANEIIEVYKINPDECINDVIARMHRRVEALDRRLTNSRKNLVEVEKLLDVVAKENILLKERMKIAVEVLSSKE